MSSVQDVMTRAGADAAEAIVKLQLNYVKAAVMGVIMPMLQDALKEGIEDAKEEAKGGADEKEIKVVEGPRGRRPLHERLAKDEKEAGKDTNIVHLESCPTQAPWLGPAWTGYQMYTIRYGKEAKTNLFYSVGYEYVLRHTNMKQLDKRLREEFKGDAALATLPALPDDCLHGVKCGCIVRTVDAYGQHGRFKPYMAALATAPFCHSASAAEFFRVDELYEQRKADFEAFQQAVSDTVEDVLKRTPCRWCEFKDPFDETEAVRQMLYLVLGQHISSLRGLVNPPFCAYNARMAAEGLLVGQLEVVAGSWSAGQEALNKMKTEAIKAVSDAGDRLVAGLKPHLIKIMTLINSKMSKPEEKKEEKKEDKSVKPGDVTYTWRFSHSTTGRKLMEALHTGPAEQAIRHAESDLNPRTILEREIKAVATELGGDGIMDVPGIGHAIRDLINGMNDQLYRFNTLAPLLASVRHIAEVRDKEETALKAAATDPAKIEAAINAQAAALWSQGLGGALLRMFSSYQSIRGQVKSAYGGDTPEEAATSMIEFVDYLYKGHVRALNALRVRYIEVLRANLTGANIESADRVAETSKRAFAQALFEVADVLVDDFWVRACERITLYACATAFATLKKTTEKELEPLLEPMVSVLPDPVAKANVHKAILYAIMRQIVNKIVTMIVTKVLTWAERKIFDQSDAAAPAAAVAVAASA